MSKAFTTPQERRQNKNVPDLHTVSQREPGQNSRQDHRSRLRGNHEALPVDAVRRNSAKGRDQKHGKLAGESDRAQQKADPLNR
jgi:hypothetical protein